jgi:cytidylate kinase
VIVAIDGPAASGKGTLARRLARHYGLRHLDTGLLYRAVALKLIHRDMLEDAEAGAEEARHLDTAFLSDSALRSEAAGAGASVVSSYPQVRQALLELQRRFAVEPPGAVLDGRDIGTVICPDADAKLFVIASPEERARRRALELESHGEEVDEMAILADIRARDHRDMNRANAPLKAADDAVTLDTTTLDAEAAFAAAVAIIDNLTGRTPKT